MSSKEKIYLHERERHPPLPSGPTEDEEEDAVQTAAPGQAKASSSSSSEEESESESDAESGERPCSVETQYVFFFGCSVTDWLVCWCNCLQRKRKIESSSTT